MKWLILCIRKKYFHVGLSLIPGSVIFLARCLIKTWLSRLLPSQPPRHRGCFLSVRHSMIAWKYLLTASRESPGIRGVPSSLTACVLQASRAHSCSECSADCVQEGPVPGSRSLLCAVAGEELLGHLMEHGDGLCLLGLGSIPLLQRDLSRVCPSGRRKGRLSSFVPGAARSSGDQCCGSEAGGSPESRWTWG